MHSLDQLINYHISMVIFLSLKNISSHVITWQGLATAAEGERTKLLFLLFLYCHSPLLLSPLAVSFHSSTASSIPFIPFSGS